MKMQKVVTSTKFRLVLESNTTETFKRLPRTTSDPVIRMMFEGYGSMAKQVLESLEKQGKTILTSIQNYATNGGMDTKEKRQSSWMISDSTTSA